MERKIVLQGNNAHTISLPIGWIRKHGLEGKDTVQVHEEDNDLRITTRKNSTARSTSIDVRGQQRLEMILRITAKYYQGFDEIRIMHDNLQLIREISQKLLGMVIEDYGKNSCTLRSIVKTPQDDIHVVIKKTLYLLREQSKSLVELAKGNIDLKTALTEEDLLDESNMYAIRYLNKYEQHAKGHALTMICAAFDDASDLMGELAKHIDGNQEVAEHVHHIIDSYVTNLLANDFSQLNAELLGAQESKETFLDGIVYALVENLYNYSAYIMEMFHDAARR